MTRVWIALLVVAVAFAACGESERAPTWGSGGTGHGGSGGAATSVASQTSEASSTSTGPDDVTSGGGGYCAACSEWMYEQDFCSSAQALYDALVACVCNVGCTSECASECQGEGGQGGQGGAGGAPASACDDCVTAAIQEPDGACAMEYAACMSDP